MGRTARTAWLHDTGRRHAVSSAGAGATPLGNVFMDTDGYHGPTCACTACLAAADAIPDIVLKHPRIFEYKVQPDGQALVKGKARIQVGLGCMEGRPHISVLARRACSATPASVRACQPIMWRSRKARRRPADALPADAALPSSGAAALTRLCARASWSVRSHPSGILPRCASSITLVTHALCGGLADAPLPLLWACVVQVDVVPMPSGETAVGVNYFREGTSFLASPVSPVPPMPSMPKQ